MAAAWQEGSEGPVRVQVRGTAGDESTIIRRMQMNMNEAAGGDPPVTVLTLPGPDVDRSAQRVPSSVRTVIDIKLPTAPERSPFSTDSAA